MFNSKKIKKLNQQQELLDAKINSLAHGQKSLAEDFEVHFKRLRQSIYTSVEDFSEEFKTQIAELKKQNETIKKQLKYEDTSTSTLLKQETETLKKQNGILNHNIQMISATLQVDFDLIKDQIKDLKNQFAKPIAKPIEISKNEALWKSLEVPMPSWAIGNGTNHTESSPIQDKMKFTDDLENVEIPKGFDKYFKQEPSTESEILLSKKHTRKSILPIDKRKTFSVNLNLPQKVVNYLHNRSSSKNISTTLRGIFEREGKLVFAPLSIEITKNFTSSKNKLVNMQISKSTYLALLKISHTLNLPMTNVVSNFVATMDLTEYQIVYDAYRNYQNESVTKRKVGRPTKK